MGVASKSKDSSIRIYNGRTHYNEWQFVYVAQTTAPGQTGPGGQPQRGGRGQGTGPGTGVGGGVGGGRDGGRDGGRGRGGPIGPLGNGGPVGGRGNPPLPPPGQGSGGFPPPRR